MRDIKQVLRLFYDQKMSKRAIARSLDISRDTVADYCTRAVAVGLSWPLPDEMENADLEARLFPSVAKRVSHRKTEPDWAYIHQELKRKGATLRVLHEEYLEEHLDGMSYSLFCQRHKDFAASLKRYLRQTHVAGERALVDYAGPTIPIVDIATGAVRYAQIFVGVMGASNYTYAEAHWSQNLANWISAHTRLFEYFGGVPEVVICDNLRSAISRASRTEPVINKTYQHMAEHYGTMIVPARPYRPKDKAKAENAVLVVERWIMFRLRKRIFTSLAELNTAIFALLLDLNNRPFQKLPGSRLSTFEAIDKPALRQLPENPFEYAEFFRMRVGPDGRFTVDLTPYSAPPALCRKEIEVRLTANLVEILYNGRRAASHPRGHDMTPVIDPEHVPLEHRHYGLWSAEQELRWAMEAGVHVHDFLQSLFAQSRVKEQRYRHANALKKLLTEYGPEPLDAACHRAIRIRASSLSNVRSILRTGMHLQPLQDSITEDLTLEHGNVRGPDYYH